MSYKKFGIDISKWQGTFDLAAAVEDYGVEFVIIKAGGGDDGLYKDSKFTSNYNKAVKAGIYKGAYFYGNATSSEEAVEEAEYFISLLKGKQFELPVYYDVESADMFALSKSALTTVVDTFCSTMESAGYYAGIYMSKSAYSAQVNDSKLTQYAHWVAQWAKSCTYSGDYGMWQFGSSTNLINDTQINGQTVDQDYMLIDYPSVITTKGYNGYTATESEDETSEDTTETASEDETSEDTTETVTETYTAGKSVYLSSVALYSSSTATKKSNTVTGTYYLWDGTVTNGRIRITNKKANVGVTGQVTGWINVSAFDSDTYSAGDKITLTKCSLYASSTTATVANTISGTYYIWDSTIKRNRIRITKAKGSVGVAGEVTGWINVSDIS